MWSLRIRQDGSFYLTYDRNRIRRYDFRGSWEYIGRTSDNDMARISRINRAAGLLVADDDRGDTRVLVLED